MTYKAMRIESMAAGEHWIVLSPDGTRVLFTEAQAEAVAAMLNAEQPEPDCTFLYFKPSGKWKYTGRGRFPTPPDAGYHEVNRDEIMRHNGGSMPGVMGRASDLVVILVPDEDCEARSAFPRTLKPEVET